MLNKNTLEVRVEIRESIVEHQTESIKQLTAEAQKFLQLVGVFSGLLLTSVSLLISNPTSNISFDFATLSMISAAFFILAFAFVEATRGYAYGRYTGYGVGYTLRDTNGGLEDIWQMEIEYLERSIKYNNTLINNKTGHLTTCINYFASAVATSTVAIYSAFYNYRASLYLIPVAILVGVGALLFMRRTNTRAWEDQEGFPTKEDKDL